LLTRSPQLATPAPLGVVRDKKEITIMADANTGRITIKKSGRKTIVEVAVPKGTTMKDALKAIDTAKIAALRKFQPGGCLPCTSGRDFRLIELERVLPAKLGKNMAAFDLKTGKLM
jgi:hypothetical protein